MRPKELQRMKIFVYTRMIEVAYKLCEEKGLKLHIPGGIWTVYQVLATGVTYAFACEPVLINKKTYNSILRICNVEPVDMQIFEAIQGRTDRIIQEAYFQKKEWDL